MTEQPENRARGFVEDLGPLFDKWTYADGRECLSLDLYERGAEEMAREFRQAEDLLTGLEQTADTAVGFGAYIVLGDAKRHAARARKVCEQYARKDVG